MIKIKIKFKSIYIVLFSIIAIVDSINGYLIQLLHMDSNLGIIYRAVLIFISIYSIFKYSSKNNIIKIYIFFMYFIFISLITSISKTGAITRNLDILLKLLLPIIIVESFISLNNKDIIKLEDIEKILDINSLIFPMCVLLPKIFGLSLSVYRDGSGFKGFFKSNNELNIIIVVLVIYCFNKVLNNRREKKYYIFLLMNISTVLLIGSKTSYLSVIIIFLVYYAKSVKKLKMKKIIILSLITILSTFIIIKNIDSINMSIDRQLYKINNNNLTNYFFSDRNELLKLAFEYENKGEYKLVRQIFGNGPYAINNYIGQSMDREIREIEMDLFDTYFYYGILGVVLLIFYYFNKIRIFKDNIKSDKFQYKFSLFIMVVFSILAGHVFYSALSGTIFALVFCAYIGRGEKNVDKRIN